MMKKLISCKYHEDLQAVELRHTRELQIRTGIQMTAFSCAAISGVILL